MSNPKWEPENAIRGAIRFAEEYGYNRWAEAQDALNDIQTVLRSIAAPDELVEASGGAFTPQALERCQKQAAVGLERLK